jgi:RecB family exonuclease
MTVFLSPSSIKDFLHCSRMFYYRKNNPEESVSTQDANIGTVVHAVTEKYWDNQEASVDYVTKQIKELSIDGDGSRKIYERLDTFYNKIPEVTRTLKHNDLIELYFEEKLTDNVVIRGKMDRVIVDDDVVIDWKTGTTKKNINNDVQFILYYVMYQKIFGHYPSAVKQVNLAKAEVSLFYPTKEYINTLLNEVSPTLLTE